MRMSDQGTVLGLCLHGRAMVFVHDVAWFVDACPSCESLLRAEGYHIPRKLPSAA